MSHDTARRLNDAAKQAVLQNSLTALNQIKSDALFAHHVPEGDQFIIGLDNMRAYFMLKQGDVQPAREVLVSTVQRLDAFGSTFGSDALLALADAFHMLAVIDTWLFAPPDLAAALTHCNRSLELLIATGKHMPTRTLAWIAMR